MSEERNFNTLPSGKQIRIHKVANTSLYRVAFADGGELPEALKGMWTDPYQAQRVIEAHVREAVAKAEAKAERKEVAETRVENEEKSPKARKPVTKKATAKTKKAS